MDNFWIEFGITAVLQALYSSFKNPAAKAKLRPVMLKIGSTILAVWRDDDKFENDLYARAEYQFAKLSKRE